MRVAVDLSIQELPEPTGVERAQAVLLDALLAADADHEYVLLTPGRVPDRWRDDPRVRLSEGKGGLRWMWRETAVPAAVREHRADLFHAPVAALPMRLRCPMLATLHELPWAGDDDEGQGERGAAHRLRLHLAAHFAARLLCVSQRTADDLLRLHPDVEPRVRVTPHGVDPRFGPAPDGGDPEHGDADGDADVDGALPVDVTGPFVLTVGRLRAKKNLSRLLDAFARHVADRRTAKRRPETLVLAGPGGDAADTLRARAAEPDLEGLVHFAGFVDDDGLLQLYRRAACVVQPSLFEGFGLPLLEAMACGAPVLASSQGAVQEAAGHGAGCFDGTDVDDLARSLGEVLDDPRRRNELVARGAEQAAARSAARAAEAVLAVYAEFAS